VSQVARVLKRAGFALVRQSGSHRIYKSAEGKRVTVPFHEGKTLHPKILMSILRDAGITPDQLRAMLR